MSLLFHKIERTHTGDITLLNRALQQASLKNDRQLSLLMAVGPARISKVRNNHCRLSDSMVLVLMEATGMTLSDVIRALSCQS